MKTKKSLTKIFLIAGSILVLIIIAALCFASFRHRKNTQLYEDGLKAFQQGRYDEAYTSLQNYLATDPNHEWSLKMVAEIEESRGHWFQAASVWLHLSYLDVLEETYVKKFVESCYRCCDYSDLYNYLEKSNSKWRATYQDFHALAAFITMPKDDRTTKLVEALPPDSGIARLIQVLKERGPAEEIAKLEHADDPVIRVEALLLDASIAEFDNKDLTRAENCLKKATELNPFLCQGIWGDFLFRNKRYQEAYQAYSHNDDKDGILFLSPRSFLNYAEAAYSGQDSVALEEIGKKIHNSYPSRVQELAYANALKAHLDGDAERMKANYIVANQQQRITPMAMRLKFGVAIANNDIQLLAQSLKYLATSPAFKETRQQLLPQITPILQANMSGDLHDTAAQIAELFLDIKPANPLVWRIVVLSHFNQKTLTQEMLNQAIEYFPKDPLYRQLALLQIQGDVLASSTAFDQWLAVSKEPTLVRFRKAEFLQQNGKHEEATEEIVKLSESDSSLQAAKLCLVFGIRNGSRAALELAGKREELKPFTAFELERRFGNKDTATRLLRSSPLEDAFQATNEEDRPVLLSLAIYLAIIHEVDRSIAVYELLKPYLTSEATVELNLSELYAAKGNKEQAMDNAKSALKRFPDSQLVRAIYGLRCAENADFREAVTYLPDTVQDTRFNNALAFCLVKLIDANLESGHIAIVREQLDRLRKVQPGNPAIEEYTKKIADLETAEAEK